jgi:flagellar basal-body rod protein FlgF
MPGVDASIACMKLKEQELEVVAHNIANANTNGFKEERVIFERVLKEQQGAAAASGIKQYDVKARKVVDFRPGDIQTTGNQLDLAIQGDGFFEIQTDKGNFYTRNGSFALDSQGRIVTQQGGVVMGSQGPIVLKEGSNIQIAQTGSINLDGEEVGQVKIVTFDDLSKLNPAGTTLFEAGAGTQPKVVENPSLLQGKSETSNTNIVLGLVRMMEVARQHETYEKVLRNQGKMDETAVGSLGRVS